MLETSKTLNTSNVKFNSEKVKDITMSNQQVNNKIFFIIKDLKCVYYNLRDYTRGIFLFERLRYSPIFNKSTKLRTYNKVPVNKVLSKNLSIKHYLHKLDPNWVTGFVDAEGCFSVIIEIPSASYDLKKKSKGFIWNKFTWKRWRNFE